MQSYIIPEKFGRFCLRSPALPVYSISWADFVSASLTPVYSVYWADFVSVRSPPSVYSMCNVAFTNKKFISSKHSHLTRTDMQLLIPVLHLKHTHSLSCINYGLNPAPAISVLKMKRSLPFFTTQSCPFGLICGLHHSPESVLQMKTSLLRKEHV
jgi:hypothetical protein